MSELGQMRESLRNANALPVGDSEGFKAEVKERFKQRDMKPLAKETHGGAKYVSWSVVWDVILGEFPNTPWPEFWETWIDGAEGPTCLVNCRLTIVGDDGKRATNVMHLPVMESYGQFKAIHNPDARDISDTRMRCFVKCAGVFGLGLEMWSGEDYDKANKQLQRILDFAKKKSDYRMMLWKTAIVIKEACKNDDYSTGIEAWREMDEEEMKDLWIAETKGGFFTQAEKEWIGKAQQAMRPA